MLRALPLIASIVALLVWVFISAVDQYYGGPPRRHADRLVRHAEHRYR
ncbi:MAG: hypothetical protein ACLUNV_03595 [Sutterella wadsworthensis]